MTLYHGCDDLDVEEHRETKFMCDVNLNVMSCLNDLVTNENEGDGLTSLFTLLFDPVKEPVDFRGPLTTMCNVQLLLEVIQGFLFLLFNCQCFSEISDVVQRLQLWNAA